MSVEVQKIKSLLKDVQRLQKHQREIEKIKGETFNIFSILGVETKENRTHSNFIAELLNPKGSHYMGHVFLQAFLEQINCEKDLDIHTAEIFTEFHIGRITESTGGRIDILIKDAHGNYISIENKIYAGDQENQLIRYYHYQKGKNKILYLTLFGGEASEFSTQCMIDHKPFKLKCEEDYHAISYQTHILDWLEECQKIAVDVPQLREAIKQYILLIKKLTNQMIDPNNLELKKALFDNAEAAQYVADNFENIKNNIREKLRDDIKKHLKNRLFKDDFKVSAPNPIKKTGIAQIFINLPKIKNTKFLFTIESFSGAGHANGDLFIGILDSDKNEQTFPIEENYDFDMDYWKGVKFIEFDGGRVNLGSNKFLRNLIDTESIYYKKVVKDFSNQCYVYIETHYPTILKYFNKP